jgi:GT2 family glycosyltransferase
VHDDAPTDDSVDIIKSGYPQVRLLESRDNVGFCVSNNRMVEKARGKFVLLLNNDAVLHKDALSTLYEASGKYGDGILGLPQYNADSGELIDIGSTFDMFLNPVPNKNPSLEDVGMIIGACLWLPKTLWTKLGGFPEWFGSMAEDMYLCCLARLWGYPVKAVSQSGFDHWVGSSFGGGKITSGKKLSTTISRRRLSERNKTSVMFITYPIPALLSVAPLHFVLLFVEGMLLALIKRDFSIWREVYGFCFTEIWRNRKRIMETRHTAQQHRSCSVIGFLEPFTFVPYKLTMLLKYGLPQVRS